MKKWIKYSYLFVLTGCSMKSQYTPATSAVTVISDLTDSLGEAEIASVLSLYRLDKNINNGGVFVSTAISNMHIAQRYRHALAIGNDKDNFEDVHFREKQVLGFYDSCRLAYKKTIAARSKPLGRSYCFRTIAQEISQIMNEPATKRYLIVVSDLNDNTPELDAERVLGNNYSQKNIALLIKAYEQLHAVPNDLSGLTVIIIHSPGSLIDDMRFHALCKAYSQILEKRHCKVIIQASSKIEQS